MMGRPGTKNALTTVLVMGLTLVSAACGTAGIELPAPRPLITSTGERLRATPERLTEIDAWVRAEIDSIRLDPSFMIVTLQEGDEVLPWEGLGILRDTANIRIMAGPPEVQSTFNIYAHLHMMKTMDRDSVWLPEAAGADGYVLEKAILSRTSDAWLYARSIFDAIPYTVLDELMYSKEQGYLEAYILTSRPDEFADEHAAWKAANPTQESEFVEWFERVFERPPPGRRSPGQGS
jgi:hypothetical protein